ncbi:hypothetical protein CLG96_13680 [Sphingomonas oleivorans]|uniref:Uncharacterized protein n=1 Tax=Sphingomonas oleivorans TaxID=1735121 RepID=A0A2T5FX24_9SPHN|nr:DUF5818 domain-containing protein [Sphingomonas oleivorans]PTQ10332.1 hypothetical protein CLG96_13680 [Sphingomonas oleivorans]
MDEAEAIDEAGLLLREGGGFVLQRDAGGLWHLDMHRVPVDLVGKRVRIIGIRSRPDLVDVEGVQPG